MSNYLLKYSKNLIIQINANKQRVVFCQIRKTFIILSPEEFVRQLWVQFLEKELKVGVGRIRIEQKSDHSLQRFDLCVFHPSNTYSFLLECKQHKQVINEQALYQAIRYNEHINATYIAVSNGLNTLCWQSKDRQIIDDIYSLKNQL